MKAYISTRGFLTVVPENETESWALKCWFSEYTKQPTLTCAGIAVQDYKSGAIESMRSEEQDGDHS